jgi:hypothetical protein
MRGPDGAPMAGYPPHGYPPQAYPPQAYSTPPAVSKMSEGGDGQPQSIQPKTVEVREAQK